LTHFVLKDSELYIRIAQSFLYRFRYSSTLALEEDGKKQIFYPKSNDGWLRSLCVIEGRALDKFILPWVLVTINAIVWTLVAEIILPETAYKDFSSYETFFGLVLNSSLAFLLVFRLNRSAERYWDARGSWGVIIAFGRTMVSGIIVHGRHDPVNRDGVIKWIASFCVATMHFIRGIPNIEPETLAGVLALGDINELEASPHPGLYAADQIRWHLQQIFRIDENTPFGIAQGRSHHLDTLEKQLNGLIHQMGTLERIRSTPLPLVYVTHLRTFLLAFLFAMPYIWWGTLGYATIPIVFLTAFALLGLEGAAQEVESPFEKNRPNHLSMDSYCLLMVGNIVQLIKQDADREKAAECAHAKAPEKDGRANLKEASAEASA
jgi:putative membrane protein